MSFTLLSGFVKLVESANWKVEALEFQQLMLDNPWIENLDIDIEHFKDQDGDHYNAYVKHPEFMDLTFHVDDKFSLDVNDNYDLNEYYGNIAKEAYHNAMPMLIGLKAGRKLQMHQFFHSYALDLDAEDDNIVLVTVLSKKLYEHPNVTFSWSVEKQAFEPFDVKFLPKDTMFKTIQEMWDYLDICKLP